MKEQTVMIRVSPELRKRLKIKAAKLGITLAELIARMEKGFKV